jgi:catechol 2,3-dioxygenase-like lactoylglutathione lyase family enzyme
MGIRRLNHAVLYVRDVGKSVAFYRDVLGFLVVHERPTAAFLRAAESDNDHPEMTASPIIGRLDIDAEIKRWGADLVGAP